MDRPLCLADASIWTGRHFLKPRTNVRIQDGRIVTIGGPPQAQDHVIDAGNRWIVPGLIDSHLHLLLGGETLGRLDLSHVRTREEFERLVEQRHAALPGGAWLIGAGWSQENFDNRAEPNAAWLSPAGNRPAIAYRMDLHAVLVNQAVIDMIDERADPPGGRIGRDPLTGTPTGLFVEAAAWELINPLVPRPDAATQQKQLLLAQQNCHSLGLTMVGSMEYQRDVERIFLPLRDQLTLRCRVTLLDRTWPLDTTYGQSLANNDLLAIVGYKAFLDGTLGSRTARMLEPYADEPDNCGLLVELARDGHLIEWAKHIASSGLSPSMHAIGDEAARLALDASDAAESVHPHCRPRIEHAQQIQFADLPRFRGRIASMQPLHKADDGRFAQRRLGPERLVGTFPFRRLLDAGATLAFGSDWPVVSCDPILGMRAAITGLTLDGHVFLPDQNVTPAEALRAYTVDAAFALGSDEFGRITEGAPADLTVLDRNPIACDWVTQPPRVTMTIVGGRVVWTADAIPATIPRHDE